MQFLKKYLSFRKSKFSNECPHDKELVTIGDTGCRSGGWKLYTKHGIELHIQPGFISDKYIDNHLDEILSKINKLSINYFLVNNGPLKNPLSCHGHAELYMIENSIKIRVVNIKIDKYERHLKFRLSDLEDNTKDKTMYNTTPGPIPSDIKKKMISDVKLMFSPHKVEVDEFTDRGYLIFDIIISS